MSKFRVGLIGCGGRGRQHGLGYQTSGCVDMVACSDTVLKKAELRAEEFGIPKVYNDYREMLKHEDLDVVSICLWTRLHFDVVLECVNAGISLINCEKPMGQTWGEAKRMHESCEAAGIRMTFSHQTRYGPTFQKVLQLVRERTIGQLIRIEGFCSNLFDLGTHRFDRMFFYNDDNPVEWVMGQVDCSEDRLIFDVPVETYGISYFSWENEVVGLLVTGNASPIQDRLIGSDGMIENDGISQVRLLRKGHSDWEVFSVKPIDFPGRETALYIQDSLAWLEGGEESLTSSQRALQGTELIFSTYESSRTRSRVYLPLEIEDSPLLSMLKTGDIKIPNFPEQLSTKE